MEQSVKLRIVPVELAEANCFIKEHHRHHSEVQGHKFSIGVADDSGIRGVCVVGRPVSRFLDNGWTLEVTRCCTDGVKNGCSMLYGAAWRVCREMGYKRLITYILDDERGTSLSACGFRVVGKCGGGTWDRKDRPRVDKHPLQMKMLWEKVVD